MAYLKQTTVFVFVVLVIRAKAAPVDMGSTPETFLEKLPSVTITRSCAGGEQKYNFLPREPQCVNLNPSSPVMNVRTNSDNFQLTFYEDEGCAGKSFEYTSGSGQQEEKPSLPPFPLASFSIAFRR